MWLRLNAHHKPMLLSPGSHDLIDPQGQALSEGSGLAMMVPLVPTSREQMGLGTDLVPSDELESLVSPILGKGIRFLSIQAPGSLAASAQRAAFCFSPSVSQPCVLVGFSTPFSVAGVGLSRK